ncbi:hypothetical protein AVEN_10484-1 [Araneus ventricosus]|uniref:Uncharacterized protein n=1 Tax=Araneus ventricosus TaxID=182803 RepID=A0A4Y2SVZ8_ARAVE|nr:hypothetical protein AVEN_274622-1 [Araneus ventricosus]GBN91055.1 hypothetical protein AVEN_10484-1 [Araneus ventricosus]
MGDPSPSQCLQPITSQQEQSVRIEHCNVCTLTVYDGQTYDICIASTWVVVLRASVSSQSPVSKNNQKPTVILNATDHLFLDAELLSLCSFHI